MSRARSAAAALAVLTTLAVALFGMLAPAQASVPAAANSAGPPQAAAETPVSNTNGTRTLIVDPTTDLPANNASIKVQGKGFSTDHGLYVAVCAGSATPADLTKCVGGSIPDANTDTNAWAHATPSGADGSSPSR